MDITQLLVVAAAVVGIVVVGFLAIIPAAMELRDVAEGRGRRTSVVKAMATASLSPGGYPERQRATRSS